MAWQNISDAEDRASLGSTIFLDLVTAADISNNVSVLSGAFTSALLKIFTSILICRSNLICLYINYNSYSSRRCSGFFHNFYFLPLSPPSTPPQPLPVIFLLLFRCCRFSRFHCTMSLRTPCKNIEIKFDLRSRVVGEEYICLYLQYISIIAILA